MHESSQDFLGQSENGRHRINSMLQWMEECKNHFSKNFRSFEDLEDLEEIDHKPKVQRALKHRPIIL